MPWWRNKNLQLRDIDLDGGKIRIHGTILHEDSLLANLMKDKMWKHLFYKAHASFDDFSNRLWPEQFSETDLRAERQIFINRMDPAGYSQEYLNDPFDSEDAYLRRDDFLPMSDEDINCDKIVCAAADFAVSTDDRANRSSLTVGGKDLSNILHFIDQRVGRWDYFELVEEMFSVQQAWNPVVFFVEAGVIWKTLEPTLHKEMRKRNIWISFEPMPSTKDKAVRGRAFQKRMRAHGCRFNKDASWYPDFEAELLRCSLRDGVHFALRNDRPYLHRLRIAAHDVDVGVHAAFRLRMKGADHAQPALVTAVHRDADKVTASRPVARSLRNLRAEFVAAGVVQGPRFGGLCSGVPVSH